MSSGPAEWREDDHRNVAIGPPRACSARSGKRSAPLRNCRWRSSPVASRARTSIVSRPTSILVFGFALRLWYQAGLLGAPPFEAKITHLDSSARYPTGFTRLAPDLAPVW